ncbi:MAG TPA: hypothetical protein VGF59_18595 [Bryobacteraceae bacterium]|jgi:hypothetical protein
MLRLYLLLLPALAFAGSLGVHAQVAGGTMASIPAKSSIHLDLTSPDALQISSGKTDLRIDYHKINTLEYGQNVSRRYAAAILVSPVLLLSKSRKHFVTLGFVDADGNQQALVLRVEKGDIRSLLASLEARSGRRIEYTDDEARKAGK